MTTAQRSRPVVRSQVEPRIVERRRTVLEARRRRRRTRWIAVWAVLALVASVIGVLWSPLADVDEVVVVGAEVSDPDELRAASGIELGDQLVTLDLAQVRDRLRRLPMVASASVERRWPDTVRIVVVEEVPLVRLRAGDLVQVVSSTGRVLPADVPGADAVEVLEVADPPTEVGQRVPDQVSAALVVLGRMGPTVRGQLSSALLAPDGSLSFEVSAGGTVRFGPVEHVPAKLLAVEAFLSQVTLECLDVLDVVRPERPTASRTPGCAVPAPTETPLGAGPLDGTESDGSDGTDDTDGDTPR